MSTRVRRELNEQTTSEFLANLEYELRLSRHSVWLGIAAREHERHLQLSRGERIGHTAPLVGGPRDRIDRSANHRRHERSHVELAGTSPSVFSGRGVGRGDGV